MFEGTDLAMAYGSMDSMSTPLQQLPAMPAMEQAPPPPSVSNKATASHVIPPEAVYAPPPAMYAQQSPKAAPADFGAPGFWDRVSGRRWEVAKLVMFALVILLALSADHVIKHYMDQYLAGAFLSNFQEFVARVSIPVGVLVVLWLMKASA